MFIILNYVRGEGKITHTITATESYKDVNFFNPLLHTEKKKKPSTNTKF